uniref:Uncharacterized protein n=1 Tax=Enterobacter cloacae TaxID=550 RepID=A0A886QJL9_ENTCL|nr:hypothetical protein JJQ61_00170 [Enterobacter cloacae]
MGWLRRISSLLPKSVHTLSAFAEMQGAVSYQTSAMKFSNAFQKFKGLKLYLYLTVPARKVTFLNRNRLASLNFLNG